MDQTRFLCALSFLSVFSVSILCVTSAVAQPLTFSTVAKGDASEQQTARQATVRTETSTRLELAVHGLYVAQTSDQPRT